MVLQTKAQHFCVKVQEVKGQNLLIKNSAAMADVAATALFIGVMFISADCQPLSKS